MGPFVSRGLGLSPAEQAQNPGQHPQCECCANKDRHKVQSEWETHLVFLSATDTDSGSEDIYATESHTDENEETES